MVIAARMLLQWDVVMFTGTRYTVVLELACNSGTMHGVMHCCRATGRSLHSYDKAPVLQNSDCCCSCGYVLHQPSAPTSLIQPHDMACISGMQAKKSGIANWPSSLRRARLPGWTE